MTWKNNPYKSFMPKIVHFDSNKMRAKMSDMGFPHDT